ncbi:MAG: ABC transporter substrate-binding protein [Alphaproteobacteria bacterium]
MKNATPLVSAIALAASVLALDATALAPQAMAAGDEVRPLTLWARTQSANPQAYQAAQLIAQSWRELGIEVDVRGIPRPQQSDLVWYNRDKWDVTMWQMVGRPERSDPDEFVYNLFHSSTAPTGYNFVGYINPEYDAIAEQQRRTTDPEARRELIFKAQQIIDDEQVYAFLVYPAKVFAFDNTVFADDSVVEQPGLGIKNIWTYLNAEPLTDQRDMILNSTDEMNAINPFYISGATDSWVTELIWDRLMRIGPDGLPRPWAAESVNWNDDTTLDVTLREGMTWHDGQPVTSADVIFSFEAPSRGDLVPMYKPFVANIESMEALDELTVRFTLTEPSAAFFTSSLAKLNLAPEHVWAPLMASIEGGGDNAESILEESRIGSGPFRFARWNFQEEVVLEANADHWAAPNIDRWIIRIVPNVEAGLGMLRRGEINFMSDYTGDPEVLLDVAAEDGDLSVIDSIDIGFQYLAFNHRRAPFDDPFLRRALSLAIDRNLMVAAAWNGFAVAANSHVSPALSYWHNDATDSMETGVEVAKALLAEGGYEVIDGRLHYPDGVTEQFAE